MSLAGETAPRRVALLVPSALAIGALVAAPLGVLLVYSLAPGGSTQADFADGVTLENYRDVLGDAFYLGIVARTVGLSLAITLASLAIGWPLAYFLWRAPQRWKALLTVAVIAPLLISIPVRNYGWMIILGDNGLINAALLGLGMVSRPMQIMYTDFAAALGLTHVLMPFVVLSVQASLERIGPSLLEAAGTLGAPPSRVLWHVIVPLSAPGIVAGSLLVFCVAVSSYVTPAIMGPSGARYAATLVYQQFVSTFDWPKGSAIAMLLLALTAALVLALIGLIDRRFGHLMRAG